MNISDIVDAAEGLKALSKTTAAIIDALKLYISSEEAIKPHLKVVASGPSWVETSFFGLHLIFRAEMQWKEEEVEKGQLNAYWRSYDKVPIEHQLRFEHAFIFDQEGISSGPGGKFKPAEVSKDFLEAVFTKLQTEQVLLRLE
jgi:hypothetical protein